MSKQQQRVSSAGDFNPGVVIALIVVGVLAIFGVGAVATKVMDYTVTEVPNISQVEYQDPLDVNTLTSFDRESNILTVYLDRVQRHGSRVNIRVSGTEMSGWSDTSGNVFYYTDNGHFVEVPASELSDILLQYEKAKEFIRRFQEPVIVVPGELGGFSAEDGPDITIDSGTLDVVPGGEMRVEVVPAEPKGLTRIP